MPPKQVRYFLARLNVIFADSDKLSLLQNALSSAAVLEVRGQRWGFYEFGRLDESGGPFFTGYLVKYKPEVEEEIVVPERHTIEDRAIENRVLAKSRFFLHAESGLMFYQPVASQISRKLFALRFAEVFEHAMANFFVDAEVQAIEEQLRFLDELKSLDNVRRVSISLHPSNPSNREVWRSLDEKLRNFNASSYREYYESDPRRGASLNVVGSEDVSQKITMAEDGYGRVEAEGQRGGKMVKISTGDNPMSILAPSDTEYAGALFPAIRDALASFWERFRQ